MFRSPCILKRHMGLILIVELRQGRKDAKLVPRLPNTLLDFYFGFIYYNNKISNTRMHFTAATL